MDVDTLKQERVSRAAQRRASRDWRGSASLLVIAVAALAASRTPAGAQAFWTGAVDQNWFNAGNWDTNAVPNAATDAAVPHGPSNQPLINGGAAKTKALIVGSNTGLATLGIINGGTLTSIGATLGVLRRAKASPRSPAQARHGPIRAIFRSACPARARSSSVREACSRPGAPNSA